MNDTEIWHSRHIIEELLEILIDANELDLTISEIEGDAILYYREGPAPSVEALLAQVEKMYLDFHAHLKLYESQRICQCGACSTAHTLSLKFIAHYGEVAKNKIKNYSKLFGREVIAVHRLLKNSVPLGEYVLITDSLQRTATAVEEGNQAWAEPVFQQDSYEMGDIAYSYLTLAPLATRVPEPAIQDYALPGLTVQVMEQGSVIEGADRTGFRCCVRPIVSPSLAGRAERQCRFERRNIPPGIDASMCDQGQRFRSVFCLARFWHKPGRNHIYRYEFEG